MPLPHQTILIIEDDADIRETLAEVLADEGFAPAVAADGRAALDWLRHNPRPDAILLDMMMPVMNGWDFRRAQLADPGLREVPIIIVSGAGDVAEHARTLQAHAVLPKPISVEHLLVTLRQLAPRDCVIATAPTGFAQAASNLPLTESSPDRHRPLKAG